MFNVCLPTPETGSFRACHFTEDRSLIFKSVVRADFKRIFLRVVARTSMAIEISQGYLLLHRAPPRLNLTCNIPAVMYGKIVKIQFFKTA